MAIHPGTTFNLSDPIPDEPASRRYATSNLTRLLAAGARLDPSYARKVINLLLRNRQKFAAPAYGYDVIPVLGHALAARRLRLLRTLVVLASVILVGLLLRYTGIGFLGALALLLWLTWAAIFAERVLTLQSVVTFLRPERTGNLAFDGRYPWSDRLSARVVDQLAEEQDASTGLVYYGGYLPFVGAGIRVRNWSFAVLLDKVPKNPLSSMPVPDPVPFTVDELNGYVCRRLDEVLTEESPDGQQIDQLVVERRWYRKAVSTQRPVAPRVEVESLRHSAHGPRLYDSAREYVSVRIGSWDQDLVTSLFLAFDLKGRTLYTELHAYVLPPIREVFSVVDRLPDQLNGWILVRVAWHAVKRILFDLIGLIVALGRGAYSLWMRIFGRRGEQFSAEDLARYAKGLYDYGAETSIRELAAIPGYRHFFQEVDAKKYDTIIERRLMEIVMDFMDDHHVDTGEYRERQSAVLQNYGPLHTGTGNIVNSGGQAYGPNATVRRTKD